MLNPETTREDFYIKAHVNKNLRDAAEILGPDYQFEMSNYDPALKAAIFNTLCYRVLQN